jgi:UDP-glucose 4-epimerase
VSKVLVTGGAGFIGSNLVRGLLERGDDVVVLDNFATGSRANLDGLDVKVVEGELRSYERVHNAVRGAEVVFHLGALGSVPRSVQDPLTSSAVNVEGTLNVLLAARDEGVRRVVYSSSSSVYGVRRDLPVKEDAPPDPLSPYGVTKLAAERFCVAFARVYDGLETTVLRFFNVFGPRQSPHSQYAAGVPKFMVRIAAAYLTQAFAIARKNPRIDMMLWFLLKDDPNLNGWQSGLITARGAKKPAFAAFMKMAAAAP